MSNMSTWSSGYSVILSVFIISGCSCADLYKGDKCSLKDGSQGICKLIKECPAAVELIKTGIHPVQCGFEGTESIVCCKDGEELKTSTSTTTTNPITSRTPGDISKQKCKEYAEYAYEKIYSHTLLLNPHFTKKLICDIPKTSLIVGSTLAGRREFPHMALIGYMSNHNGKVTWQCGGSLISENFVLTAGHCLSPQLTGLPKLVRFGLANKTDLTHMQERTVKNVKFNTYVRPACLQTERSALYDLAIASGWGVVKHMGKPSNDLLKVVLEFVDVDKCNLSYNFTDGSLKDGIVDDLMICAGVPKAVRTVCRGDSGGPLQVYHQETEEIKCMYDIIGVISFGKSCGLTEDNPTVHTRVSTYIKWIEDTVWPNE